MNWITVAASGWELAIKKTPDKLEAPDNLEAIVEEEGFSHLPITFFMENRREPCHPSTRIHSTAC